MGKAFENYLERLSGAQEVNDYVAPSDNAFLEIAAKYGLAGSKTCSNILCWAQQRHERFHVNSGCIASSHRTSHEKRILSSLDWAGCAGMRISAKKWPDDKRIWLTWKPHADEAKVILTLAVAKKAQELVEDQITAHGWDTRDRIGTLLRARNMVHRFIQAARESDTPQKRKKKRRSDVEDKYGHRSLTSDFTLEEEGEESALFESHGVSIEGELTHIDWDAVAITKRRGYPMWEGVEAPEKLTPSEKEEPSHYRLPHNDWPKSDLKGYFWPNNAGTLKYWEQKLMATLGLTNESLPDERLVDPMHLSEWISKPCSIITD